MTNPIAMKTPNIQTAVSKSHFSRKSTWNQRQGQLQTWRGKVQNKPEGSCIRKQGSYQRSIGFSQKHTGQGPS